MIDPSQAQKVNIETKSEQVYRFLRESIILGDFAPGERLVLAKLAEKYGVSEIPIREACKSLAAEGLVVIKPYEGITVTEIDADEVAETIEIRAILEKEAARQTVPVIMPVTKNKLQSALKQMEKAISEKEINSFGKINKEFHILLLQDCPNKKLRELTIQIWGSLERARSGFRSMPEQIDKYFGINMAIFHAIEQGDSEKAGDLLYEQAKEFGSKLDKYLRSVNRHK